MNWYQQKQHCNVKSSRQLDLRDILTQLRAKAARRCSRLRDLSRTADVPSCNTFEKSLLCKERTLVHLCRLHFPVRYPASFMSNVESCKAPVTLADSQCLSLVQRGKCMPRGFRRMVLTASLTCATDVLAMIWAQALRCWQPHCCLLTMLFCA